MQKEQALGFYEQEIKQTNKKIDIISKQIDHYLSMAHILTNKLNQEINRLQTLEHNLYQLRSSSGNYQRQQAIR